MGSQRFLRGLAFGSVRGCALSPIHLVRTYVSEYVPQYRVRWRVRLEQRIRNCPRTLVSLIYPIWKPPVPLLSLSSTILVN